MRVPDGAKIRTVFAPGLTKDQEKASRNIILLQGRASFIEKFHEIIQGLTERGYNVWSFDWRGQGLSSRTLTNHHKCHIDSYETYLQDLHQFMQEVVQPQPNQMYMAVAQSMGGHIALRYVQDFTHDFSGAMLVSPMMNIQTGYYPKPFVKVLSAFLTRLGFDTRYVIGQGDFYPILEKFEGNYLTGNLERYKVHLELQNNNMSLVVGGVTYGWLQATFKSIETSLNPGKLKNIKVPIFIVESEDDRVVDNSILPYMVRHMHEGLIKTYPHTRHQIFMESDETLNVFWRDLEAFSEHLMLLEASNFSRKNLQESPTFFNPGGLEMPILGRKTV